jgi:hypothetical protein
VRNATVEGVTVNRMVHFVPDEMDGKEHLAAIIVKVHDAFSGLVNLHVFTDGEPHNMKDNFVVRNVKYSTKYEMYTWHWPERG